MFGSHIAHAIAGEATTTLIGLQETDVSVYNTLPRTTSYGCYRRAEVLETHVRITRIAPRTVRLQRSDLC